MKESAEKLPLIIIERPKMPRSTWEALRAHIVRERLRKKQEQEQTQEVSRWSHILALRQGDQIGRFFAYWEIFLLKVFFLKIIQVA
jgi:hypothetical protein